MAMMCAEYYGAHIKLIKLIILTYPWNFGTNIFSTIKVKHCCRKHMCTARHDIHIWLSFKLSLIWLKVTLKIGSLSK